MNENHAAESVGGQGGQRLKHIITEVRQGWSPQCYPWPADGVETWGVLKAGAANGGIFKATENKQLPENEAPRPELAARRGDLVISRANTRELVGSAAVVDGHYPRLMLCDKLYALRLDPLLADSRYVSLRLGTRRWRSLIELEASGSSPSMQNISQSDILNLPMELPDLDVQRTIVEYLDRETTRIDILIEEQQRLVGMLHERRRSVAHELFGRTIGMCPLKHVTADVTVGIVVNPAAWYVDDGVPALRGLNVRPGYINSSDLVYLSAEGDARHEKSRLRTGDVIVVRTGQAGAASVVPPDLDGANAIDLLIIRPGPGVDPHFLAAYLNAPSTRSRITEGSVGAIQGHFNVAALRELPFPALGITEQRVCAEQWLDKSRDIDNLIAETERFIELSRERRSALITAAVTGQVDVRREVA